MSALQIYTLPIDWEPDEELINSNSGIHYLAWQVGINQAAGTASWLIAPVREDPEPLEDLLPELYEEKEFTKDVTQDGEQRVALSQDTLITLKSEFSDQVALISQAVEDGYLG